MLKRLTSIGNSLGLIIDRPILDLLDIDRDTELEIKTDGKQLIIRPARARKRAGKMETANSESDPVSVKEAAKSFFGEFRDAFK